MYHIRGLILFLLMTWTTPLLGQSSDKYPFQVAPTKAFAVLKDLPVVNRVALTPDEASMFADIHTGRFKTWSLAEASLVASGVKTTQERKKYFVKIDSLAKRAALQLAGSAPKEKGALLLKFLHLTTMKKYSLYQTDVSVVFDTGDFNCVSSAVLYNILAERLGLEVGGVLVKNHMFSQVYIGAEVVRVETTNKRGFSPAKPKPYANPREVRGPAMLGAIYSNHAAALLRNKRYPEALKAAFSSLAVDPHNREVATLARTILVNLSAELGKAERYQEALQTTTVGLRLAPTDAALLTNQKVFRAKLTNGR